MDLAIREFKPDVKMQIQDALQVYQGSDLGLESLPVHCATACSCALACALVVPICGRLGSRDRASDRIADPAWLLLLIPRRGERGWRLEDLW